MDDPFSNGTSGLNVLNSTACQYAWEHSNNPEYSTNTSFNAFLTQCVGIALQAERTNFWAAYCNNPPDDNCPYGYCPNTDVAGPLTRLSAYITSFATACLLELAEHKTDVIWAQLLTIYSILISTCISVLHGNQLGRVHAELALLIVGSPLTCHMWMQTTYSLIHFRRVKWDASSITRHLLLISVFAIYVSFVVFSMVAKAGMLFSQESCYKQKVGFFMPFFLLTLGGLSICTIDFLCVSLFVIVEWNRRKSMWLQKRGRWYLTWRNVKEFRHRMWVKYAHTRFFAFVGLPFAAWVLVTESTASTQGGIILGNVVTFGSLLTLLASLPLILGLAQAAAENQAALRKARTDVVYEKTYTFDLSESGSDPSLLEKDGREYRSEAGGAGLRQWWKDLGRAIIVGWKWLLLSTVILGLASLGIVLGIFITEAEKDT
ncbi:hypothetical protein NEOLEDRAFT_1143422 [Neolentinus lepideus HHB14362 ss-1]|uniref:Uncharacterized protein n=1 Tax=Neolentinus lepideus HHB14362 ss-1 TaxID=1314782 RepID=A0A165MJ97_9AGAM|nr:hypothetical protein NEOLEDRAFT_1143422 [Neolentinus lepideus HHB14362 ss-1]